MSHPAGYSSLNDLSDIILPDPVPFWPLGQGAYLLLIGIAIAVGLLVYLYLEHYRSNQYRRAGLSLLSNAATVHDVSVVLKRVALAVFARERVASLYGESWLEFLKETCSDCNIEDLCQAPQARAEKELIDAAGSWIRNHKVNQGDKEKPCIF